MRFSWFKHDREEWRHDRVWWWLVGISVLINGLTWATMIRLFQTEQSFAPLHYTIYFGTDLSVGPRALLVVPAFGLLIILIHAVTSIFDNSSLWRRTWMLSGFVLNALLLAASGALYYVARIVS